MARAGSRHSSRQTRQVASPPLPFGLFKINIFKQEITGIPAAPARPSERWLTDHWHYI